MWYIVMMFVSCTTVYCKDVNRTQRYYRCFDRICHRKAQTSQSWPRCVHGQCEGKVSKQEFQDLNLMSNKEDASLHWQGQQVQVWILCTRLVLRNIFSLKTVFRLCFMISYQE